MAHQTIDLINQLSGLSSRLSSEGDPQDARMEALRLTRLIAAGLEPPETAAMELAYSVRLCILYALSCIMKKTEHTDE